MEKFDEEVFDIAETDPFITEFADLTAFCEEKYYICTKLHKELENWFSGSLKCGVEEPMYMSGIKGIGKSTSLLYIALQRLKCKQNDLLYIDLKCFQQESKLKKFEKFACDFKNRSTLIIDHATLDNWSLVEKIIKLVQHKRLRIVVMETGFTASMRLGSLDLGKTYQLDEVEFTSIWNGTLEKITSKYREQLLEQGKEVYTFLSERNITTPRLLIHILCSMLKGKAYALAYADYSVEMRSKIDGFSIREDDEEYLVFNLHTRILLHFIDPDEDCIMTCTDFSYLHVAINIFAVQFGRVTKDDLEKDKRFEMFNIAEGDLYARISHLVPEYAKHWQEKYPRHFEIVSGGNNCIYEIMFKYGGARKEFDELLVHHQIKRKLSIRPEVVSQTNYEPSATCCEIDQVSKWTVYVSSPEDFCSVSPTKEDLSDIKTEFQGCERDVAKCAILLRKKIEQQGATCRQILFYPKIGNLMGVDYFFYRPFVEIPSDGGDLPHKKRKVQRELNMVQVSVGASHTGETIGKSLNVVKQVFSDTDIIIHVMIIIVRKNKLPYRLQKCKFENVSVINLATNVDALVPEALMPEDSMLNKLTQILKQRSHHEMHV